MSTRGVSYEGRGAPGKDRGFALISALLFLVVLTIMAVSAMGINTQGEKMMGFSRDRQLAMQAAEAALRDAERYLLLGTISGATGFVASCASGLGLYQVQTSGLPIWKALESGACADDAWLGKSSAVDASNGKSLRYGTLTSAGNFQLDASRSVSSQPRFIIEVIQMSGSGTGGRRIGYGPPQSRFVYRVTAVGFGQRLSTRVVLQAVYRL